LFADKKKQEQERLKMFFKLRTLIVNFFDSFKIILVSLFFSIHV